ncbi:putative regulation of nuclear pre-mRNA domain-containing protein 2 [Abeliophyllum distichum]|uniref:Regulation of nuclear pre-mRNA domain-containing protein 2 n=1 Tax=Abeliophyllum distichum TaxID=126358 RepID=A0ABD1SUW2_9LAMI
MFHNFMSRSREQSDVQTACAFTKKSGHIEEDHKSAAAAVAAKLTASTSSAEMLTYVISSLASKGVISNQIKESVGDYSSEKRSKIENDHAFYVPQNPQASILPYSHHASIQHNLLVASQESNPDNSLILVRRPSFHYHYYHLRSHLYGPTQEPSPLAVVAAEAYDVEDTESEAKSKNELKNPNCKF